MSDKAQYKVKCGGSILCVYLQGNSCDHLILNGEAMSSKCRLRDGELGLVIDMLGYLSKILANKEFVAGSPRC